MVMMVFAGGEYQKELSDEINRGRNSPPEPFDAFRLEIEDLFAEANNWLDGEPIATQQQADDVSALVNRLRKVLKDADDQRKAEKKPHDDAAKAVQALWTPLLSKAELAASTARNALAVFLRKKEDEQRAGAEALRKEAEQAAEAAAQSRQLANPESLSDQTAVRVREEAAAALAKAADRAAGAKAHAKGGERAVGLRSDWKAEVTDALAFGKWAWEHRRDEYLGFLTGLAQRECRQGPKGIPGIIVHEVRKAV
jgi:hypothetical protein